MSVLDPVSTEVFRLTSHKALANNPSVTWVNTYEFTQFAPGSEPTGTDTAVIDEIAQAIVNWERAYHHTSILFTRRVVSTWLADSEPYNGDEFLSVPTVLSGTVIPDGQAVSLEQCLFIQRVPLGGRTGKIYWRGCLDEAKVEAPGGRANLIGAFLAATQEALDDPGPGYLDPNSITINGGVLVMAGRNTEGEAVIRRVTSLVVSDRVVFKKLDNRYFRRGVSAPLLP